MEGNMELFGKRYKRSEPQCVLKDPIRTWNPEKIIAKLDATQPFDLKSYFLSIIAEETGGCHV
jgi:hypothetical protein